MSLMRFLNLRLFNWLRVLFIWDYWNKKSEEYNEIVDLFNLYKESTKETCKEG